MNLRFSKIHDFFYAKQCNYNELKTVSQRLPPFLNKIPNDFIWSKKLHLDDFDVLDVFSLTAEPHLNPRPIDFSFNLVDALVFV